MIQKITKKQSSFVFIIPFISVVFTMGMLPCFAETRSFCHHCYLQLALNEKDENSYIENNKKKATENTNHALFKVYRITCLVSTGKKALTACKKAISINPNDAKVNTKKTTLMQALKPPQPKPKPKPKPKIVLPKALPPPAISEKPKEPSTRQSNLNSKQKKREQEKKKRTEKKAQAQKNRVKNVQKILNQLGFNIGIADGIAGKKTKIAIKKFQQTSQSPLSNKIDKALLSSLKKAQKKHKAVNNIYILASEEKEKGQLDKSLAMIKKGLKKAPWHKDLKRLKVSIQQHIALQENVKKTEQDKNKTEKISKNQEQDGKQDKEKNEGQDKNTDNSDKNKKQIAQLITKAKISFSENKLTEALSFITNGLKKSPGNESLLSLRKKINTAQTQKKPTRQEELLRLIKEKQQKMSTNDDEILKEKELLLKDAQQTLKNSKTN